MMEFAKGLRRTVKKIFDQWAHVGQRADDPLPAVLGPAQQEPITNVPARQKIEIGVSARVKRKIFEALGYDAIGDRRARLPVVQHGSNVGLVMRGYKSGFAGPKINAGKGDLVAGPAVENEKGLGLWVQMALVRDQRVFRREGEPGYPNAIGAVQKSRTRRPACS